MFRSDYWQREASFETNFGSTLKGLPERPLEETLNELLGKVPCIKDAKGKGLWHPVAKKGAKVLARSYFQQSHSGIVAMGRL